VQDQNRNENTLRAFRKDAEASHPNRKLYHRIPAPNLSSHSKTTNGFPLMKTRDHSHVLPCIPDTWSGYIRYIPCSGSGLSFIRLLRY
jgi:hypothetical protein